MTRILVGLALLLASAPAQAGKLAEGFKGIPYGEEGAAKLATAPSEHCTPNVEPGIPWYCDDTIGEANVKIAYAVEHGLFTGVVIRTEGYTDSAKLVEVFKAAYGRGSKQNEYDSSSLPDWRWRDGRAYCSWEYNQFSHAGQAVISDLAVYERTQEIEKARAAEAVNDL